MSLNQAMNCAANQNKQDVPIYGHCFNICPWARQSPFWREVWGVF